MPLIFSFYCHTTTKRQITYLDAPKSTSQLSYLIPSCLFVAQQQPNTIKMSSVHQASQGFLQPLTNNRNYPKDSLNLNSEMLKLHEKYHKPKPPIQDFASSQDNYGRFAVTGESGRSPHQTEMDMKRNQRDSWGGEKKNNNSGMRRW